MKATLIMWIKSSMFILFLLFNCASTANLEDVKQDESSDEIRLKNTPIYHGQQQQLSTNLDDLVAQMTVDEKIGQLFWMAAYTNKGRGEINTVKQLIKNYHIGGVTWFRDTKKTASPTLQLAYTNELQSAAKYPLIISIDGEWGLDMRLDSTMNFPRQLALGAINNDQVVYEFGKEVGRQMKRMGIHVNFAPVIDVNNNPNNPVINDRSFGEDIYNVAQKGTAYMNGMHDAGILATAKHFPGHGDTDTDSHLDLPVINHPYQRLDSLELYPFKQLIQNRIGAVMVAHLSVPAFDNTPNQPTTLSPYVVTDLLQNQLGFDGLVITDAMNMKGLTKHYSNGKGEVEALKAGNDILLYSPNIPVAVQAIKTAINNGEITEARLDKSVKKILAAKRWLGILNQPQKIPTNNLVEDLNQPSVQLLNEKLHEHAITLVKNYSQQLPFRDMSGKSIATVGIDNGTQMQFQTAMNPYGNITHFSISSKASPSEFAALKSKLAQYNTVLVGLSAKSSYKRRGFGITQASINFIQQLQQEDKLILTVFGNPYSVEYFTSVNNLIVAYNNSKQAQKAAAEAIFGVIPFQGSLPVGVYSIPQGTGVTTQGNLRLKYSRPEALGFSADVLYKVDSIALDGIKKKAYPGCQILVAKNNQVIYHKAFGYHTFSKKQKTTTTDIFDLASITKIAASMPAIMNAYESGFLSPNQRLGELSPILKQSNKSNFLVGEVLNHTSGLKSWIPFYKTTLTKSGQLSSIYKTTPATGYVKVANNIYIKESYETDSMLYRIKMAENNTPGRYVYSDLGYYFFKNYLERIYNKPFETHLDEIFYQRVGFPSFTYNPLEKFSSARIVPTEKDDYFRNQTLRGYVHDMGAAMQGGVGGHAGLFGNAYDLAAYMQLLLNEGEYGGVRYFQPTTIQYFTSRYNQNSRKALGFDKPELDPNRIGPTCEYVSPDSFGHTGFTGTITWADPQNDIIFIFLSNRTYPSMNNKKLMTYNIRPKMQEAIWRALDPTCKSYYDTY